MHSLTFLSEFGSGMVGLSLHAALSVRLCWTAALPNEDLAMQKKKAAITRESLVCYALLFGPKTGGE